MHHSNHAPTNQEAPAKRLLKYYGHPIPIGENGRRIWTKEFKRDIGGQMHWRQLTVNEVAKNCGVSPQAAQTWRRHFSVSVDKLLLPTRRKASNFVELVMETPKRSMRRAKAKLRLR